MKQIELHIYLWIDITYLFMGFYNYEDAQNRQH